MIKCINANDFLNFNKPIQLIDENVTLLLFAWGVP